MKKVTALLLLTLITTPPAAADWKGHLATLFDAQIACTSTGSAACEPFLAEAVAVAEVLTALAKPPELGKGKTDFSIVFHNVFAVECTQNWFASLNGQRLLHSALGLSSSDSDAKSLYWTSALLRASQELCRS